MTLPTARSNWPSLVQKRDRYSQGGPTDLLDVSIVWLCVGKTESGKYSLTLDLVTSLYWHFIHSSFRMMRENDHQILSRCYCDGSDPFITHQDKANRPKDYPCWPPQFPKPINKIMIIIIIGIKWSLNQCKFQSIGLFILIRCLRESELEFAWSLLKQNFIRRREEIKYFAPQYWEIYSPFLKQNWSCILFF